MIKCKNYEICLNTLGFLVCECPLECPRDLEN